MDDMTDRELMIAILTEVRELRGIVDTFREGASELMSKLEGHPMFGMLMGKRG